MMILASTNFLVAGPLPPGPDTVTVAGSVSRVSGVPFTTCVVEALPTTRPPDKDVKVTLNWPRALVTPAKGPVGTAEAPLKLVKSTVTGAPLAGSNGEPFISESMPSPRSSCTVTVKVWGWPTSLVSSGVMVMNRSPWTATLAKLNSSEMIIPCRPRLPIGVGGVTCKNTARWSLPNEAAR